MAHNSTSTDGSQHAARRLRSVANTPTPPTRAQQALIDALRAHPLGHDTASELARQAGVANSSARRVLVELAEQGSLIRIPGLSNGPGRTPDRWSLPGETTDDDTEPTTGTASLAVVPASSATELDSVTISTHEHDPGPENPAHGGQVPGNEPDPTIDSSVSDPEHESLPAHTEQGPVAAAGPGPDMDSAAHVESEPGKQSGAAVRDATPSLESGRRMRAGKNELRGKVEQYLIDHPDEQFGPHALGQALGHSAGAITNVLGKLIKAGHARQTQTKPRRFAASAEHPA